MPDPCQRILESALADEPLSKADALGVLSSDAFDVFSLVAAAYQIRHKYFGKEVIVHILNNVQNGLCPEDCRYCAQSTSSSAPIESYPMKSDDEIMAEAKNMHSRWPTMTLEERRTLVELLVKDIIIGKTEITLNICYRPSFEEMTIKQRSL